ncbi:hypothetical protein ACI5KX_08475 [Erythrobacter sp. GH1-10]|uniref:hypothetical protein n=1 Tax=Erythrobacter sp. GH1-10 TaxID=3349334 RepID=UPI003877BF86
MSDVDGLVITFSLIFGVLAAIAIVSWFARRSYRRTRKDARLMKKSLGIYVADEASYDAGFDGGFDGGGDGGGGGD